MWLVVVCFYSLFMLAVLGGLAVRRNQAHAERRRAPRVGCRFRAAGVGSGAAEFEGNVSVGGAMVVLPHLADTSSLAFEALDPEGSAAVPLKGRLLSVDEGPFGFSHHLAFDADVPQHDLETLVQRLGGALYRPAPAHLVV